MTKPVIKECKTAEELVAYCARVSNPANQGNHGTAGKLLKYLIKNKHLSPLEMVDATIEIITTRDIARQMLRHRTFVFQEFSQRYAEAAEFVEPREARLQDTKNRQNSIKTDDSKLQDTFNVLQELATLAAKDAYKWAIENGIAKEQARSVLPEGLTVSRLYMKGNLRSWIHYCQLRMDPATQLEHREVASACWDIICDQFPSVKEILSGDLTPASA
jgi:thymidylate synthase (FAD)